MRELHALTCSTASLLVTGCDSPAGPGRVAEPAVLVYYGESSRVLAPDTVARGVPFEIRVPTFGGGCTRAIAETRVVVARDAIEVRPYNWRREGSICTQELTYLEHRSTVRVTESGTTSIRVRGERRGGPGSGNREVELVRELVVR